MLGHYDWATGKKDEWWAGERGTVQEPVFVPKAQCRSTSHNTQGIVDGEKEEVVEGAGYILTLLNHLDVLRNSILIFDALNLAQGPLAVVHLPVKLRLGLHGNFVEQGEIDAWIEKRKEGGEVGPAVPAREMLPWQRRLMERGELGSAVPVPMVEKDGGRGGEKNGANGR